MKENDANEVPICWERVQKKLELYAFRITGLANIVDEYGNPIEYTITEDISPLDLVSRVLYDFFLGEKIKLDPTKPLTERYLLNLLKKVLKRRYYDLLRRSSNRRTDYAEEIIVSEDTDEEGIDFFDTYNTKKEPSLERHSMLSDPLPTPDDWFNYKRALMEIYEHVKDEKELKEMVMAICEQNLRWPKEIAEHLKTSVSDINNRQKKLRRRFKHLQKPQQKQRKAM